MTNRYQYHQPKTSADIKCSKDCMVRSVTLATGRSYEEVHRIMYGHGWRAKRSSSDRNWELQITSTLRDLGFTHRRVSFPGIKGEPRKTALTMPSTGTWILRSAKHVACLKEGVLLDTWNSSEKCVYFAWEILPA